jgi:hypothetical protein
MRHHIAESLLREGCARSGEDPFDAFRQDGWATGAKSGCCSMTSRATAGGWSLSKTGNQSLPGAARCSKLQLLPHATEQQICVTHAWNSDEPRRVRRARGRRPCGHDVRAPQRCGGYSATAVWWIRCKFGGGQRQPIQFPRQRALSGPGKGWLGSSPWSTFPPAWTRAAGCERPPHVREDSRTHAAL